MEADWNRLSDEIKSYNWSMLFKHKTITEAWNLFKSKLDISMRKYIPMKNVKFRDHPPWFDSEIFKMSKAKNRLSKIYKQTNVPSDKANFAKYI